MSSGRQKTILSGPAASPWEIRIALHAEVLQQGFPSEIPDAGAAHQGFPLRRKRLLSGPFRRPALLPDQPVFSIGVFEFRDDPVARFFFCRNDQAWLLIVQCCHECVLGSINFNTDRSFCCVGRKDKLVSSGPRESNYSFGDSTAG